MSRARPVAVVILLLSYGAVGARQPAVRIAAPLGVSTDALASTLGLTRKDRGQILIEIVRLVYDSPDGRDARDAKLQSEMRALLRTASPAGSDLVPLPLDPSIWRETILRRQVPDAELVAAILSERNTALLYHGLAALDDETLAALGPDRDTLLHLRRHPGKFAAFGRSIRIHAGRVVVPGEDADQLWQGLVGAEPSRPGAFVRRLFDDGTGRLAYLYDTIAHLDPAHQRLALGTSLPAASRLDRLRALLQVFEDTSPEWRIDDRPFMRPMIDPALTLRLIAVDADGRPANPARRRLWNYVFRSDEALELSFREASSADFPEEPDDDGTVDAAWLVSRIHRVPPHVARRRLEAFLFAQRALSGSEAPEAAIATAIHGFLAFPALCLTLEQIGGVSPETYGHAALAARTLSDLSDDRLRRSSVTEFQAALAIIERAVRSGGLSAAHARARISSLVSLEISQHGYEGRLARWLRDGFLNAERRTDSDAAESLEESLLAAIAGVRADAPPPPVVQWEGLAYRVDPARAELLRLRRVRMRQGGPSLDEAVDTATRRLDTLSIGRSNRSNGALYDTAPRSERSSDSDRDGSSAQKEHSARVERILADTLASILYAAHLGDPEGSALSGGNVALRHDLGFQAPSLRRITGPWRWPTESFGSPQGWHVIGSLLGLENALGRLSLRRLDATTMPTEPAISSNERQTIILMVALLNPHPLTDAARDEIAAALARGRARLSSLTSDRREVERVAREAGLSEWRREALAWTVAHHPDRVPSQLSLLELLWLGAPRRSESAPLDPWGGTSWPLTGCARLQMPQAFAWEELAGRPSAGLLSTRAVGVTLLVADTLASLDLPAALAPGVVSLAMQDVIDNAAFEYFDDWTGFEETVRELSRDRVIDYIAALAADGPLIPAEAGIKEQKERQE